MSKCNNLDLPPPKPRFTFLTFEERCPEISSQVARDFLSQIGEYVLYNDRDIPIHV